MTRARILVIALASLSISSLAACGSTSHAQTVTEAMNAYQDAMIRGDAAGACKYVDTTALKAQIEKSHRQYQSQDCETMMTTVLTFIRSSGQPIPPVRDVKVVSQTATTAKLSVTDSGGHTSFSDWTLTSDGWKVSANTAAK